MVRIRLRRTGRKKTPTYRIVVADSTSQRFILVTNSPIANSREESPLSANIRNASASYSLFNVR